MATLAQRSFAAGEISPSLYARVDTNKYQSGLRTCKNAFVRKDSGVSNRPGTQYINEVFDATKKIRIVSFLDYDNVAIIIEFGHQYFRVYKNGSLLTYGPASNNILGATQASPIVITGNTSSMSVLFDNNDIIYISGVSGMTELNGNYYLASDVGFDAGNSKLKLKNLSGTYINSTTYTAYTSGGTLYKVAHKTTSYTESQIFDLQFFVQYITSTYITIIVTHPSYEPKVIQVNSDGSCYFSALTYGASAVFTSVTNNGAAGSTVTWGLTSNSPSEGESELAVTTSSSTTPSAGTPVTISWTKGGDGNTVRVYKKKNGLYGFIGTAEPEGPKSFTDDGIEADTSILPPSSVEPFSTTNLYPAAIGGSQQRCVFGGSNTYPQRIWFSQPGSSRYSNLNVSTPGVSTDGHNLTITGKTLNRIKFFVDLDKLVVFTTGGEYMIEGNDSGVYAPAETTPKQVSFNGCGDVPPLILDNSAIYLQQDNRTIRDLSSEMSADGYKGSDLTIFSSHLFDGVTVVDWAYQRTPNSMVWIVLSNGKVLTLTYTKEQQIIGWAQHEFTNGLAKSVCVAKEGNVDYVYFVVERTIDSATVKYIEKLSVRSFTDIRDATFLDSYLSYDGRNTGVRTMTLSGGSTWAYDENLTLTASSSYFSANDVDNAIFFYLYDETVGSPTYGEISDVLRCTITAYTSGTVVTVRAHKTVPVALRTTAKTDWARAVDQVSGLDHLEGETVSVFADGNVVGSPNNESYTTFTVSSGAITLDKPYAVIYVGLPYTTDIETLDIDNAASETVADKYMRVSKVTIHMEKTRGLFVGPKPPSDDSVDPLENLYEMKVRNDEGYDESISLDTTKATVNIQPEWNSNGRVFIRQVDPLPMSILAILPDGNFPFRGGG